MLKLLDSQDLVPGEETKIEVLELWQKHEDGGKELSLESGLSSSFDARAKRTMLASKLNSSKLEIEEIRLNVMLKGGALKPLTTTVLELENRMQLQENEEVLSPTGLTGNHRSRGNEELVDSWPIAFIVFVMKVEDGMHRCRNIQESG